MSYSSCKSLDGRGNPWHRQDNGRFTFKQFAESMSYHESAYIHEAVNMDTAEKREKYQTLVNGYKANTLNGPEYQKYLSLAKEYRGKGRLLYERDYEMKMLAQHSKHPDSLLVENRGADGERYIYHLPSQAANRFMNAYRGDKAVAYNPTSAHVYAKGYVVMMPTKNYMHHVDANSVSLDHQHEQLQTFSRKMDTFKRNARKAYGKSLNGMDAVMTTMYDDKSGDSVMGMGLHCSTRKEADELARKMGGMVVPADVSDYRDDDDRSEIDRRIGDSKSHMTGRFVEPLMSQDASGSVVSPKHIKGENGRDIKGWKDADVVASRQREYTEYAKASDSKYQADKKAAADKAAAEENEKHAEDVAHSKRDTDMEQAIRNRDERLASMSETDRKADEKAYRKRHRLDGYMLGDDNFDWREGYMDSLTANEYEKLTGTRR